MRLRRLDHPPHGTKDDDEGGRGLRGSCQHAEYQQQPWDTRDLSHQEHGAGVDQRAPDHDAPRREPVSQVARQRQAEHEIL